MLSECEPHCATTQITPFYDCHAYDAKCGRCASEAYAECAICPRPKSEAKSDCEGDHPVWHPDCRFLAKHQEIAGAAYNVCPVSFPIPIVVISHPATDHKLSHRHTP